MAMGSSQLVTQFPITIPHDFTIDINKRRRRPCSSIGSRMRDWEKDVKQSATNKRFRFNDGYEFGFRDASKQRIWWYDSDDDDGYDDAGAYEGDVGFDIREASIADFFFKIFRAFGWMIPAVTIALLMGSEHDSIIMALALPLAQTALSLLSDALWGRSQVDSSRPRSKNKKKRPLAGTRTRTRVRKEKEMYAQSGYDVGNYKSWVDSENKKEDTQNFGGWDELDNEVRVDNGANATKPRLEREPVTQERVKSGGRTKRDTHLFIRLMIATFPFLRFWTRLL